MLLIRSQDKKHFVTLEMVKSITILENDNSIIADYGNDFWITLGRYKTKEKAIQVLDKIGEIYKDLNINCKREVNRAISGNFINGINGYGFVQNGVFNMPEE